MHNTAIGNGMNTSDNPKTATLLERNHIRTLPKELSAYEWSCSLSNGKKKDGSAKWWTSTKAWGGSNLARDTHVHSINYVWEASKRSRRERNNCCATRSYSNGWGIKTPLSTCSRISVESRKEDHHKRRIIIGKVKIIYATRRSCHRGRKIGKH